MERIAITTNAMFWDVRRFVHRGGKYLGMGGILSLVLLVLATGVLLVAGHMRNELAVMETPNAALKASQALDREVESDATRLEEFRALLEAPEATPDLIKDLVTLGDKSGLALTKGEYRREVDAVGGFQRYRLTLPVEGDPDAVMAFVINAVKHHPNLALETVDFHREHKEVREIRAQINFVALMTSAGDERHDRAGDNR